MLRKRHWTETLLDVSAALPPITFAVAVALGASWFGYMVVADNREYRLEVQRQRERRERGGI